jgi:hypothetical protein
MEHLDWIREYDASRYLWKLSDDALKQRYDSLAGNLWSTDADGNVTPPRNSDHRKQLLRLLVHVLRERSARKGNGSIEIDEAEVCRAATSGYRPPRLTTAFVGQPSGFAKFGKKEHIRRAFEEGVLRVAPASGFNDPSLNQAQKDDELQHWVVTRKTGLKRGRRPPKPAPRSAPTSPSSPAIALSRRSRVTEPPIR